MGRIGLERALIAAIAAVYPTAILAQPAATAARAETSPPSKFADDAQRPVTLAQFEQAAQIAKLAAEHGLHELSQRAIRRALANGPPLDLQALPALGKPKPRTVRGVRPTTQASPTSNIEAQVSQALDLQAQAWQSAPAEGVYQTLASVVMPEGRPGEIFLYDNFSGTSSQSGGGRGFSFGTSSGGFVPATARGGMGPRTAVLAPLGGVLWPVVSRLLVDAAKRADRLDDLTQRVSARDDEHNEYAATILLTQCALAGAKPNVAACWPFFERLARHDPPDYASRLLHELADKIRGPEMPAAMAAWLEARLDDEAGKSRRLADNGTWLKLTMALAHWQFAHGNVDQARRHLQRYAEFGKNSGADAMERERSLSSSWLRVAREYVHARLVDDALEALARYAERPPSVYMSAEVATEPLVAPVWLGLRRLLLEKLSAIDRYKRLLAWTMPESKPRRLRFVSCLVPHDGRPAVFQTDLYRSWPDDAIASNFQLLLDSAREARLVDDLQQRLDQFPADESFETAVLHTLLSVEAGREEEAAPVIDRLIASQQAAPGDPASPRQPISGAAYLLARTCLRTARLREHGAMLAQLFGQPPRLWTNRTYPGLLDVEGVAAAGCDFGLKPTGLAEPRFVHWNPARAGENWMTPFAIPIVWAEDRGYLRCLSGRGASALVLDCPLVGSGELSVDLITRGAWGSIAYGGISVGTHGVWMPNNTFPAAVTESMPRARRVGVNLDVNRWTLHFEPEANLALNNGELVYDIPQPSAAAPWLALCSWSPADAVFRRLTMTGDWRIPREINLIDGNRPVGWMSGFYDVVQAAPGAARRRTSPRGFGAAQTPPVTANPGPPAFEQDYQPAAGRRSGSTWWASNRGTIHGGRFQAPGEATPMPSRLTYFRPLQNGDVLHYEFAYQPGLMIHPALDRLTFLLEPEGVRLHWMTDHADVEAGDLPLDNVADEPAARRGPARLPFIDGSNRVALKLVDDKVLIELNGVLVFERKLENTNDRRFSFFHYRDQTQAVVSNVVLSGDWPEKLPSNEELFARMRPLSEAEREVEAKLVNAEQFEGGQPEIKEETQ